jgi:hypothetical protein
MPNWPDDLISNLRDPFARWAQNSAYDIAIELMPNDPAGDWSLFAFVANGDRWKVDLAALIACPVSLVAFRDDDIRGPFDPRDYGICLWKRD